MYHQLRRDPVPTELRKAWNWRFSWGEKAIYLGNPGYRAHLLPLPSPAKYYSTGEMLVMGSILQGFVSEAKWHCRKCMWKPLYKWVTNQNIVVYCKEEFGQINHVVLLLNHHSCPLCQLSLQPLEITWWAPLHEVQLLVCTLLPRVTWWTPICQVGSPFPSWYPRSASTHPLVLM